MADLGAAASRPGMPMLDPSCVDSDFVLHNRQLLPVANIDARRVGEDACFTWETRRSARLGKSTHLGADSAAGLMNHDRGAHALGIMINQLVSRAANSGCAGFHLARMELHLSGFFSMIASVIKPWTAAIRLGRALLTPSAPGLLDPNQCASVDLGCFFERIGPEKCEPARPNLAQFRFSLSELQREALSDAQSIPNSFRHFGSFWWVSQLTYRLLRPRRSLKTLLRDAARQSGLTAALASGLPVIGIHVRHGDACIKSESYRTVRSCEPLAKYMATIQHYAEVMGVHTIFLATDSESVLRDAHIQFPGYTFLHVPNVSRTGVGNAAPAEVLDERIKRRARDGVDVSVTQRDALLGVVDALLLSRCNVLVGKFTSGLFRAAYALASARRGGMLPPFVSLDAPWCADYGLSVGYNDNFPRRDAQREVHEQIDPDQRHTQDYLQHEISSNTFQC